jgi:hypothetical protein
MNGTTKGDSRRAGGKERGKGARNHGLHNAPWGVRFSLPTNTSETATVDFAWSASRSVEKTANLMADARKVYERALAIQRRLAARNPDAYLPDHFCC